MGRLRGIALFLLVVLILISAFNAYSEFKSPSSCLTAAGTGTCEGIQNSPQYEIFGIKSAFLAFPAFVILFLFLFLSNRSALSQTLAVLSAIIIAIFASYLIGVQLFIVGSGSWNYFILNNLALIVFILTLSDFAKNPKDY